LLVTERDGSFDVSGNECKLGICYAEAEKTSPMRHISTSLHIKGGNMPMLSVKTKTPIPKGLVMEAVRLLHTIEAEAPVSIGDVIVADILGTGCDIVATRHVPLL